MQSYKYALKATSTPERFAIWSSQWQKGNGTECKREMCSAQQAEVDLSRA